LAFKSSTRPIFETYEGSAFKMLYRILFIALFLGILGLSSQKFLKMGSSKQMGGDVSQAISTTTGSSLASVGPESMVRAPSSENPLSSDNVHADPKHSKHSLRIEEISAPRGVVSSPQSIAGDAMNPMVTGLKIEPLAGDVPTAGAQAP